MHRPRFRLTENVGCPLKAQIMERLAIHDVAGLTRFAIRAGLVSSDK